MSPCSVRTSSQRTETTAGLVQLRHLCLPDAMVPRAPGHDLAQAGCGAPKYGCHDSREPRLAVARAARAVVADGQGACVIAGGAGSLLTRLRKYFIDNCCCKQHVVLVYL